MSGTFAAQAFAELIPTPDGFIALAWWDGGVIVRGSADGSTWERLDGTAFGAPIEDLVAGPSGWIASQRVETPTGLGAGTVLWFSTDGRRWQRLPDQAALGASFPGPLAAGSWGFAMAGQVIDGSGTSVPAVWVSRDGRQWQRVEPQAGGFGGTHVFVTSTAVVAIDRDLGRVAITTDGSGWSEPVEDARLADSLIGLGPDGESLVVTTADGEGLTVRIATFQTQAASLELQWADADPAAFAGAGATGFATGERGALLVGYDLKTLAPRTWLSTDGRTWQMTDLDPTTFGGGVPTLAAVGKQALVTLGWQGSAGGALRTQPWVSLDGRGWSPGVTEAFGILPTPPAPTCPSTAPTDVAGFLAMTDPEDQGSAAAWPSCFGHTTQAIEGWIEGCGGCGGVPTYVGSPGWLLNADGYFAFWLSSSADPEGPGGRIGIQLDPSHPVAMPEPGTRVRVSGHFDDPASAACRLSPIPGWFESVPPSAEAVARCRASFVAEEIEVLER